MGTLLVGDTLQDQLKRLTELPLLTDPSGVPLGHFMPGARLDSHPYGLAESQCPNSADQLQQMRYETDGRPLSKIWLAVGNQ